MRAGAPGFAVTREEEKIGLNSSSTADLVFEDTPAERLGAPGAGMRIALRHARRRAHRHRRAGGRDRPGGARRSRPPTPRSAAPSAARSRASRRSSRSSPTCRPRSRRRARSTWRAARLKEAGHPHTVEGAQAKLFASRVARRQTGEAIQVLGGYGYTKEFPAERYYRDAKVTEIYEGTSEIQRLVIARALLGEAARGSDARDERARRGTHRALRLIGRAARRGPTSTRAAGRTAGRASCSRVMSRGLAERRRGRRLSVAPARRIGGSCAAGGHASSSWRPARRRWIDRAGRSRCRADAVELERRVCEARERTRWALRLFAGETGVAHSTMQRDLARATAARVRRGRRAAARALRVAVPGRSAAQDVKRYPRFAGPVTPSPAIARKTYAQKRDALGHALHAGVDDHSRAYGALLDDDRAETADASSQRALAWFAARRLRRRRRLMTDGAWRSANRECAYGRRSGIRRSSRRATRRAGPAWSGVSDKDRDAKRLRRQQTARSAAVLDDGEVGVERGQRRRRLLLRSSSGSADVSSRGVERRHAGGGQRFGEPRPAAADEAACARATAPRARGSAAARRRPRAVQIARLRRPAVTATSCRRRWRAQLAGSTRDGRPRSQSTAPKPRDRSALDRLDLACAGVRRAARARSRGASLRRGARAASDHADPRTRPMTTPDRQPAHGSPTERSAGTRGATRRRPSAAAPFTTLSGEPVRPLYTEADLPATASGSACRASIPFTRGVYPSMYRGRLWTMRQFAGFGTAEETNERFRYLLDHGQTGLSTAFDMPSLMGHDSDHRARRARSGARASRSTRSTTWRRCSPGSTSARSASR